MKQIKHYKCEICETEYSDVERCQRCEQSHIAPQTIAKARYLPNSVETKNYPVELNIVFGDGTIRTYRR